MLKMNEVLDTRPASELSDIEVVAYLYKSVRANEFRTAQEVVDMSKRLFPDMSEDRRKSCLHQLATALSP